MAFNDGFTGRSIDSITGSDGEVLTRVAGQWVAAPNAGSGGTFTGVTLDPINPNLIGHGTTGEPLKVDPNLNVTSVTASAVTVNDVITNYINFNDSVDPSWENGRVWYNNTTHELNYWTEVNGFNVKLGQQLVQRCQNDEGAVLTKGTIVHLTGSTSSDTPRVVLADWTNDNLSANTLGLVAEDIAVGDTGYVIVQGILKGINTNTYTPGQILFLSSSGQITGTKPQAPKHTVSIGQVIRKQNTNGSIYVSIQNGYELGELHDVLTNGKVNGDLLAWDSSALAWKNTNILSGNYAIDTSGSSGALRIIQRGTGDALLIQDESPDSTPSVIKSNGDIVLGGNTSVAKLTVYGNISSSLGITGSFSGDGSGITNLPSSLTLTTNGTSGSATLVGSTLNIPTYIGSIPNLSPTEVFRGFTPRNNSTTLDTYGGLTISTTGSPVAQSAANTSFLTKQIRIKYTPSVVATGQYCGVRDGALWYIGGGFRYVCAFGITDTSYGAGCRQFYGMSTSTADLGYNDTVTVASLTNLFGIGSDAADTNLQIFYNDAAGTASKIDLGSSFPANRTAGAAMTTVYHIELYNPVNSSIILYRVKNVETGVAAEGTLSSDLPASTSALNCFASRCMGGPISGTGEFCITRFGVYSA